MAAIPQKFFYKLVAVLSGRFFLLSDGKTELTIGEKATGKGDDTGLFTVYQTAEDAENSGSSIREKSGLIAAAPKTVLKVMAWGECVQLEDGRLAFSCICPLFNIGLTHTSPSLKCDSPRSHRRKRTVSNPRHRLTITEWLLSLPYWREAPLPTPTRRVPVPRPRVQRSLISVKRSLEYPAIEIKSPRGHKACQSVGRRPKKLAPLDYNAQFQRISQEAALLEQELHEVERRAALLKLEEDLDLTDSVDMTPALKDT